MEQILHIIGLCPESASHLDILDLLTAYLPQLTEMFNQLKTLYYVFK